MRKYRITMVFLFFDTNIIQNLACFGEFIFDNYLSHDIESSIKKKFGSRMILELDALRQITFVLQRGSLPVAISVESLREILKTSNQSKRNELVNWGIELLEWWKINRKYMKSLNANQLENSRKLVASGKLDFLKNYEDRLLIAEALTLGCDTFLTFDRRTILIHKKELAKFGINVLSPREFVDKHRLEISVA